MLGALAWILISFNTGSPSVSPTPPTPAASSPLQALKLLPREKVQVATKYGIVSYDANYVQISGKPEYVCTSCEASLKRLDTEYIDLYYQHRIDQKTPIAETELYHIACLVVDFGWKSSRRFVTEYFSALSPKVYGENSEKNKPVFRRLETLAKKHQCTPAQLALAWILHQGEDVVPIPGTTKIKNLDDNIGSLKVTLTKEDMEEITDMVKEDEVSEKRTFFNHEHVTWRYANTPPVNISEQN